MSSTYLVLTPFSVCGKDQKNRCKGTLSIIIEVSTVNAQTYGKLQVNFLVDINNYFYKHYLNVLILKSMYLNLY